MTDETVKRIEEEAEKYGSFRTTDRYKKIKVNSYIAGAKSERNKVLDEAIDHIPKEWNNYATLNDIISTLESLKL